MLPTLMFFARANTTISLRVVMRSSPFKTLFVSLHPWLHFPTRQPCQQSLGYEASLPVCASYASAHLLMLYIVMRIQITSRRAGTNKFLAEIERVSTRKRPFHFSDVKRTFGSTPGEFAALMGTNVIEFIFQGLHNPVI